MNTSIKLSIEIENDRFGYNISGKFQVTEILFSDFNRLMDAEEIVKQVKQSMRALKSYKMLSIYLTEGEQFSTYPEVISAVRFTNSYGEVKMAHAVRNYFDNWNKVTASDKDIYQQIRSFVQQANTLQAQRIAERVKVDDNQLPPPPSEIYLAI